MQGYLLDDFKVEIDERCPKVGGCWQGEKRNGLPTAWGMDELKFFYNRICERENPVILDVGANTGAFSSLAAMHPTLRSYAFEPSPITYELLNINIALNNLTSRVKTFQVALSDKNQTVVLKCPRSGSDSGFSCIGTPLRFNDWIEFQVQAYRLDDIYAGAGIEKADLIKIDTEGCELFVLKGAENFIRQYRPDIFCEYHEPNTRQFGYNPEEILKLLTSWGYEYKSVGEEDVYFYLPRQKVKTQTAIPVTTLKFLDDTGQGNAVGNKQFAANSSMLKPAVQHSAATDNVSVFSQSDIPRLKDIKQWRQNNKVASPSIVIISTELPKYNGGAKLYNLWIKLLRQNGFNACIATKDGSYEKWLVNHQPVISYQDCANLINSGKEVRLMTGWLDTPGLDELTGNEQFYYFDAELAWTLHFIDKLDYFIEREKIAGIATHSRYIQSWYMTNYGVKPLLINEWSDQSIFYESPEKRIPGRIGYMPESRQDEQFIDCLRKKLAKESLAAELVKVEGDETQVAQMLRTVDIFLGLNPGKNMFWGEGCPRTQQESLHCGCVLAAFDCLGNREFLHNNWTGLMVDSGNYEALCSAVEFLLNNPQTKEFLRANSKQIVSGIFSDKTKFDLVSSFLDIDTITKQELQTLHRNPFWLNQSEVPFLAKQAGLANNNIVEIGCAYGGSTSLFLAYKKPGVQVYSIDPFVPDSKGGSQATDQECINAVRQTLATLKRDDALTDWHLIKGYSHDVVNSWTGQIDLLFIDGSHHYEDVKRDFLQWQRFLSPQGKVIIHDSRKNNQAHDPNDEHFSRGWSGPTRLIREIKNSPGLKITDANYSITVVERVKQ